MDLHASTLRGQEPLSFSRRYPHLAHLMARWEGTPPDLHERSIGAIWVSLHKGGSQRRAGVN